MSTGFVVQKSSDSRTQSELPACIHELFEQQVGRTPEAVALTYQGDHLTYRELNEQANQLAHHLRGLGIVPETPVALYLERSPKMVIAILGVLKAGAAYVPIDLAYPKERLSFMLEDTQAPLLLTQNSLRSKVPAHAPQVICLDSQWERLSQEPQDNPSRAATKDNCAYIIYTSGSTGKPKGVLVTHYNVVRLLRSTRHWYGFNPNDVWPLFHSYAFDVSVWELWGALLNGGRLVVVPHLVTRSPAEFYELLAREKITVLNQTPSAFRQLIWAEGNLEKPLGLNLRYVICAGEALELQSLKPWFDRHGDARPLIVNMYGITETTVHSTYRVIRKSDLTSGAGSVIGVPIPDLQLYLVDENLKPVPAGTPGEICVGGAGVARGYLNRPELTNKRFLPDPFSGSPGARLYRSGDLGQMSLSGELEYLGRIDHQVKIRGFRVELGEIESALNRHPAIRESVVVAQDGQAGDKRLVAYVVASNALPTISELRAYLGQKVPDYMIPALFVFLKWLPLTTNGKVDRRALPNPDGARPELTEEFVAPRTEAETTLAKLWSEVLEVKKVGINDNFFELGGDSIRSITFLSRAGQAGLNLMLEDIFSGPTIASLAARARHLDSGVESPRTKPFDLISAEDRAKLPPDVEDAYPVARLQMGMFFYNELDPISAIYHDIFSYRIKARFDRVKLQEAVHRLVRRHPLLRTSFRLEGYSEALQLIHRNVQVPFTIEDLSTLSPAEQEIRIRSWIDAEKWRRFDRATPPLVRFHTQLWDSNSFQFIISFHHSCLDGWSLATVVTEVFQDYLALLRGMDPKTSAPKAVYRDFVALERRAISSPTCQEFWSKKVRDAATPLLPRWPGSMRAGGHEQCRGPELQVPENHFAALKKLAQAAGVPLRTVLLAAHQRVMAFLYGQEEVTTGLITNGRPEKIDGEKIVGLFLNTLPLRQALTGGTWVDLVKQTFAAEQEILPHRRFPLAEIQKLSGGQALFETAFDFVHFHVYRGLEEFRELDLAEGHYFEANNLTTYTTFMLDVTSTKLELHIDYDPNAVCRAQIERMSQYYLNTLEAMATNPDGLYETSSPFSQSECRQILTEWNATAVDFPREEGISQLFEKQAQKNPENIALEFDGTKVTYRQLNEESEQIAQHLLSLDLGREELVGICLERSPEMMAALLGILKAGGAYVPLDPAYPKERLELMIQDAKLRFILTQKSLLSIIPAQSTQALMVESLGRIAPKNDKPAPKPAGPCATDLAYVIYTSGSTGKPKGVQVTHRSVVNLLTSAARTAEISASDKFLAVTTLSFDIAGLELFMPLICGGRVILANRETCSDGKLLASLIEASDATVMQGTPATWRLLLEAGWEGKRDLKIFCGGEALQRGLADELLSRNQAVWNFYGPTETTIWSTAWKVPPNDAISIGRPLANTQAYILDSLLRPVPVGTIGELHLGGEGLARGYLNRPDLTVEKFIPNPFTGESKGRLYRTGDLARYLPDGQIECLGRIDHQVKVHGFRIELGEIETVLRGHHGIADALVSTREGFSGEKTLVGYVISKNGPPSMPELRDYVKTRLPAYMVPTKFVLLKQFPLTPNGKIDRRALPAPENSRSHLIPYMAPRNAEEQSLAEIWQEVLSVKQVGIEDDFFELGGDSLSATRAFARINKTFEVNLTLRAMLECPTIRSLSELVTTQRGTVPESQFTIRRQPRAWRPEEPR